MNLIKIFINLNLKIECRDLDFDRAFTMTRDRRVWREVVRGNSPD